MVPEKSSGGLQHFVGDGFATVGFRFLGLSFQFQKDCAEVFAKGVPSHPVACGCGGPEPLFRAALHALDEDGETFCPELAGNG
jgi:hypothetical protein